MHSIPRSFHKTFLILTLLTVLLSSCSMPGIPLNLPSMEEAAPQPASLPTSIAAQTPQNYAPAIIETVPLAESTIGVNEEITFYFNQPMDRGSVETAWIADPVGGGEFIWADDATLKFKPSQALQAGASLKMGVNTGARSATGQAFSSEEIFTFNIADALHPRQYLPEDGSIDISVDAAVVASFDQPVVPLGADPATLPAGFTLDPQVAGRGEWLNTSTDSSKSPMSATRSLPELGEQTNWDAQLWRQPEIPLSVPIGLDVLALFFMEFHRPTKRRTGLFLLGQKEWALGIGYPATR